MPTEPLQTVLSEDLDAVLRALGIFNAIQDGTLLCRQCQRVIAVKEVSMIVATDSGFEIVCSNSACTELQIDEQQKAAIDAKP